MKSLLRVAEDYIITYGKLVSQEFNFSHVKIIIVFPESSNPKIQREAFLET